MLSRPQASSERRSAVVKRSALFTLLSYWRHHLFQLAALITGLALATALWSAVQAINAQARTSYAKAEVFLQQADRRSLISTTQDLRVTDYVALKRTGWRLSPVLEGNLSIGSQDIDLIGIDFLTSPQIPGRAQTATSGPDAAFLSDMLGSPGGLIMHPETADRLSDVAPRLVLRRSETLPIGIAVGDIAVVSRLLERPDTLTRLVLLSDIVPSDTALRTLPAHIQLDANTTSPADPGNLTESFHLNLTAFGFLSFAVGLFIVQGTIGLAMEQRRGLFRTLRCLGVPFATLVGLLIAEVALVAVLSAGIGLSVGYFLAAALLPDVAATLSGLYGAQVSQSLSLQPQWALSGLAMTLLGAGIASAQSFHSLWRLPILQAPSTRARGQQVVQSFASWAFAGVGLIALGVLALLLQGGLMGGFLFLGGIMLGVALTLPYCLSHFLRLGQGISRHPLLHWLWADARAQLPGMSLALMALMLALAANIGVGTMVSSFRLTFTEWMDQRLSAELYVTARDDAQGAALESWLEAQAVRVLPIRSYDLQRETGLLKIYGVRDDPTYRENWPMLAARAKAWDLVANGTGILISEQFARREGLDMGDHVTLPQGWPTEIVGVYSDYGNPHGQAIVSLAVLLQRAPNVANLRFGLRLPGASVPDLIKTLQERFDIKRENLVEQTVIKQRSMAIFDQTFLVTDTLKLLTLGVAGFAIFTSLITLWNQRLPQLGPIWAMGVRRKTLAQIDILRSLLMAGLTALVALPLGLLLSWALLVVINTEAFGWRLPVYLFPLDWLRLVGLALLAALFAALIPAWRLFRLQPNELLKVFSSER